MILNRTLRGVLHLLLPAMTAAADPVFAQSDLASLSRATGSRTHRASSFDRTGGNTENVISFGPGEVHTMLETEGPGRINHIWLILAYFPHHHTLLRNRD